jgi:hypothetical protein
MTNTGITIAIVTTARETDPSVPDARLTQKMRGRQESLRLRVQIKGIG